MNFELTYFNAEGKSVDSHKNEWIQKGKTWLNEKLGFRFNCIERNGRIEIPQKSIREQKEFRIHTIIMEPERISLPEGNGGCIIPHRSGSAGKQHGSEKPQRI